MHFGAAMISRAALAQKAQLHVLLFVVQGTSVASPIICRSALAIEANRGVASLANTARYGLREAPCAALRWLRAAYDLSSLQRQYPWLDACSHMSENSQCRRRPVLMMRPMTQPPLPACAPAADPSDEGR